MSYMKLHAILHENQFEKVSQFTPTLPFMSHSKSYVTRIPYNIYYIILKDHHPVHHLSIAARLNNNDY